MKKPFCDICGAPALETLGNIRASIPVGEPRRGYETERDGSGCDKVRQCVAVALVHFTFDCHPKGFGGPPDLCAHHAQELVALAAARLVDERSKEATK